MFSKFFIAKPTSFKCSSLFFDRFRFVILSIDFLSSCVTNFHCQYYSQDYFQFRLTKLWCVFLLFSVTISLMILINFLLLCSTLIPMFLILMMSPNTNSFQMIRIMISFSLLLWCVWLDWFLVLLLIDFEFIRLIRLILTVVISIYFYFGVARFYCQDFKFFPSSSLLDSLSSDVSPYSSLSRSLWVFFDPG